LTSLLAAAVTIVLGLFTTPLLVHWLGDARFGACRVLLEYSGYLAVLELGLGGALSALLVRAVNGGDSTAVRRVLVAGVRLYAIVVAVMLAVGALATPLLRFLGVPPELSGDLQLGWLLCLLGMTLLPLSPFRTLLEAEQRGYWNNLLLLTQLVLTTLLSVLLAWVGWGIAGQMLAPLLAQLPVLLLLTGMALSCYPGLLGHIFYGPADPTTRADLHRLNGPTLAFTLCGRISLFSDNIILSVVAGPAVVTILFATQRLATLFQAQLQTIGSAVWAGLAQLHVRGEKETFNNRLIELSGLIALLGAACLVPVVAFNGFFVRLWLGPERYAGELTTVLAAANAGLVSLLTLWGWCFASTGRVRLLLAPALVNAAINLAASIAGAWLLGPAGPLLGTFVSYTGVTLWWMALLLRREFGTPLRRLTVAVARPVLLALPCVLALRAVAEAAPPTGWLSLAVAGAGSALGYLALSWFLVLSREERRQWLDRVRAFRTVEG
jgi:O-antigen/teichoic acid export membrane protein